MATDVRRVRRAGVVRLPLNRAGVSAMRTCSARTVAVTTIGEGRSRQRLSGCRAAAAADPVAYETPDGDRCDWIDPAACLLPVPERPLHATTGDST